MQPHSSPLFSPFYPIFTHLHPLPVHDGWISHYDDGKSLILMMQCPCAASLFVHDKTNLWVEYKAWTSIDTVSRMYNQISIKRSCRVGDTCGDSQMSILFVLSHHVVFLTRQRVPHLVSCTKDARSATIFRKLRCYHEWGPLADRYNYCNRWLHECSSHTASVCPTHWGPEVFSSKSHNSKRFTTFDLKERE